MHPAVQSTIPTKFKHGLATWYVALLRQPYSHHLAIKVKLAVFLNPLLHIYFPSN